MKQDKSFDLEVHTLRGFREGADWHDETWSHSNLYIANFAAPLRKMAMHLPSSKALILRNMLRQYCGFIPARRKQILGSTSQLVVAPRVVGNQPFNRQPINNYYRKYKNVSTRFKLLIMMEAGVIIALAGYYHIPCSTKSLQLAHVYFPAEDAYFESTVPEVVSYLHIFEHQDQPQLGQSMAHDILLSRFEHRSTTPVCYDSRNRTGDVDVLGCGNNDCTQGMITRPSKRWYHYLGKFWVKKNTNPYSSTWKGTIYDTIVKEGL